jgi:peptide/nickel transport system permease protein
MATTATTPEFVLGYEPGIVRSNHPLARLLRLVRKKPLGFAGFGLVAAFLVMAIFAPLLVPYSPTETVARPLLAPSAAHLFGTDSSGNDVLSRVIAGAQISLTISFAVVIIHLILGTTLGMVSGYYQGTVDYLIQRSGEVWSAFPGLIALLLIVSLLGTPRTTGGNLLEIGWDMRNLIFAFSIGAIFGGSRIVRGLTISLKRSDYVIAARALGASDRRILLRHIMPNILPIVIVTATAGVGGVILGEAALSFLGLGVAPGTPSWGQDLSGRNRLFFRDAWWMVAAPGVAISLTVLGFNLFGDALRDLLDPRLRSGRRRTRSGKA